MGRAANMELVHRKRAVTKTGVAAIALLTLGLLFLRPAVAHAAEMVEGETQFVLNTFAFLVWGSLVMWMCAGFTMLESGAVRTKNASMICLKNIGIYSIAGLAYFIIGYNLMYVDVGNLIGSFQLLYGPSASEIALLDGSAGAAAEVVGNGYSVMSDWFFQMVFVATTASIVSGAIAERVKMWPFFLFTLILTALIYPIVGAWTWGGGWLAEMGFQDFAGSTIVHGTGGWAALAGVMIIGPRLGKFRRDGSVKPTPPSNVLVVTLGVFILWLGWFGFNGGSQLALGSALDAVAMSNVLVNTNLAAAAGVVAALAISRPVLGHMDLFAGLNGAIAGARRHHRRPRHHRSLVGDHHRCDRRCHMHRRDQALGEAQNRRCRRCDSRPLALRHLGNSGGQHRRGRQVPHPATGCSDGGSVRIHRLLPGVAPDRPDGGPAGVEASRTHGPGQRRTRNRGLPRVRAHARRVRR